MNLIRLAALCVLMLASACSDYSGGSPCGGNLTVDAQLVLPDTGLGAGGTANIGFNESEPGRDPDDTSLIVWTSPAANRPFADAPPRVRVLTDDGRVFLDLQSTPAASGSWYVIQTIAPGSLRDDIVTAFQTGHVAVEFSMTQPTRKVTLVRPTVRFAGRTPVIMCL